MKHYRKSHRYKRKKPIYRNRFFWFSVLFSIIIASLFYFVFFTPTFKIKEIVISGNQKVSTESIENIVQEVLASEGDLFFITNTNKVKMTILLTHPEIGLVNVKMRLPDRIIVEIKERQTVGVWCQNENICQKIDEEGVIFENIGEITQGSLIVKDFVFQGDTQLGEKVIEKDDLASIFKINSQLKDSLNIPVREFVVSSEDKLTVVAEDGWELYFDVKKDVEWQLTKLKTLLSGMISFEQRKYLEYIELRFGNFANPKFKAVSTP